MSAPLVINLRDGSVWERRGVNPQGVALYALAGSCKCPEYLMATEAELAAQGIAGSADVLPVPVGPELRTLGKVEDELTGVSLSLYEEELDNARLRLALASAQRGRRELRAQVAALLDERHTTNESLDDAIRELRARDQGAAVEDDCDHPNGYGPYGCAGCGASTPADDDVRPQVLKLRALLAGQQAQAGGAS